MKKLILAIALIFTLSACTTTQPSEDANNDTTTSTINEGDSSTETTSPVNDDGNQEVVDYALELNDFSFSPDLIEVEAGETITVRLTSVDMQHDFVIDELNVRSSILSAGGDSETIEITVPAGTPSGTEYEFYCSVNNHRALGMVGTLRVR